MANISENVHRWDREYDWPQGGDEWSIAWGGADSQWFHTLYPRIRSFVPAGTILEIAPGFGRWTQYLKDLCTKLVVVDLAETCIQACQKRFANCTHISYHVNDGKSLAMVEDRSIDFAFSFDSLVHVESDVLDAYVEQLATKLTCNGIGVFHHSNIGTYAPLIASGSLSNDHWRALSVTAAKFRQTCTRVGLECIHQELLNWSQEQYLTDCISVFTPQGSHWPRPSVIENKNFMKEAGLACELQRVQPRFASPDVPPSAVDALATEPDTGPEDLSRRYEQAEADRAKRLRVIEQQGRLLGELESQRNKAVAEVAQLRASFDASEADRADRLRVIEQQGRLLGELESQRNQAVAEVAQLRASFDASEADRAERLKVIQEKSALLGKMEGERNAARADLEHLRGVLDRCKAENMAQRDKLAHLEAQLPFRLLRLLRLIRV